MRRSFAAIFLLFALLPPPASAAEWSRFRGPNGSGVAVSDAPPVEFGPERNKEWETLVPFGRSSPSVGPDRVFLTAVEGGRLLTLAVERASGKELWRRAVDPIQAAELHEATDSATPTPVTDGQNVYVFFHEAGLVSYGPGGDERWRVPLGPFRNFYSIASSPVIAGDTVVMVCDQAEGSFVLATDSKTGKERWRRKRSGRLESYTTPVLYPDAARPRAIVVFGSRWVDAYDVVTGETLWSLGGVGSGPISSPVLAGQTLFVNAPDQAEQGWPDFSAILEEHDANQDGSLQRTEVGTVWIGDHFGWLDADGSGVITAEDWTHLEREVVNQNWGVHAVRLPAGDGRPEIAWNYRKNVPYIPSPLVYDGLFYMVKDDLVTSLDAATGELRKRGRLGAGDSPKVYASPIAAGGRIYIATLEGKVAVLSAGPEWTVLKTNDLGEEIWATPAIADGHLYVRTRGKLYSFAAPPPPAEPGVERPAVKGSAPSPDPDGGGD